MDAEGSWGDIGARGVEYMHVKSNIRSCLNRQ